MVSHIFLVILGAHLFLDPELHVDLASWMTFAMRTMADIAVTVGKDDDFYRRKAEVCFFFNSSTGKNTVPAYCKYLTSLVGVLESTGGDTL